MTRSPSRNLADLLVTRSKIQADNIAEDAIGGSSVTAYATAAALPLSGNTTGDQAYVSETGRLYIFTGTGWYNIALINTNPTITSGADALYGLNTDGTPTIVTLIANDPEGLPITWSYSVTTGSLTNGGGNTATVTQADNVFTITPSTNQSYAGEFEITFTASDGVNISTSTSSIRLSFVAVRYENLGSTSSTANTGTGEGITSTTGLNASKSSFGGAYSLYIANGVVAPTIVSTINGAITFEYWCYLQNATYWQDLGQINSAGDTSSYKRGLWTTAQNGMAIKNANDYTGKATVNMINTWMHIAMCCDANSTKYYRDGVLLSIANAIPAGNIDVALATHPGYYQDIKVSDAFIYPANFVPTARTLA
jgi:hypothetical protein